MRCPLCHPEQGSKGIWQIVLSQLISPAPLREQHILRADEQEMERGRWKSAVRSNSIVAIKTESQ